MHRGGVLMRTAIVYYSKHHENTFKLLEAIDHDSRVMLIDVEKYTKADLSGYDAVGFASGIYYSRFQKDVLRFAKENLPQNAKVFFIYTYGMMRRGYTRAIRDIAREKNATVLGEYGCQGFNTFGPLKLIGGMSKDHPNQEEISGAISFYRRLCEKA